MACDGMYAIPWVMGGVIPRAVVRATVTHAFGAGGRFFFLRDVGDGRWPAQIFALRSLSALPMTETELKLIAAAASIGLSSSPKTG